jgi:hypothetical protein
MPLTLSLTWPNKITMAKILEKTHDSLNPATLMTNSNQTNSAPAEESKGLFKIPEGILQFVPFLPLALESMTGQKIPPMGGTMADIQSTLQNLQTNFTQLSTGLQQALVNQEKIFQRIVNLESNANQQLISLDKRLENLQSLRLTHEREKKQIELNANEYQ